MFSRTWRNLRNESLNTELAAEVSYNQPAIDKLVKRVRKSIDRPPMDAKVDLNEGQVEPTESQTGLRVKYNTLAKQVEQTLLDPGNTETVKVQTKVVQPKVSTKQLAQKYPAVLIVNRGAFKLTLYKNLKRAKTYGIAVGQVGLETPGRPLQHPEQGREPGLARAGLRLGRRPGAARSSPATTRRTRSRRAGWASSTAPASTARPRTARSAPPPRTAASGCGSRK